MFSASTRFKPTRYGPNGLPKKNGFYSGVQKVLLVQQNHTYVKCCR